jgi:hypothetical protein
MHNLLSLKQHIRLLLKAQIKGFAFELAYNVQPTAVQRLFVFNAHTQPPAALTHYVNLRRQTT